MVGPGDEEAIRGCERPTDPAGEPVPGGPEAAGGLERQRSRGAGHGRAEEPPARQAMENQRGSYPSHRRHTHCGRWILPVSFCPPMLENVSNTVANPLCSMLAVMTMNVGYFLSILGGTFLGSIAVGRFATMGGH